MKPPASNVLLVEDDPQMHEVLSALLHEDNITLANAANENDTSGLSLGRKYFGSDEPAKS